MSAKETRELQTRVLATSREGTASAASPWRQIRRCAQQATTPGIATVPGHPRWMDCGRRLRCGDPSGSEPHSWKSACCPFEGCRRISTEGGKPAAPRGHDHFAEAAHRSLAGWTASHFPGSQHLVSRRRRVGWGAFGQRRHWHPWSGGDWTSLWFRKAWSAPGGIYGVSVQTQEEIGQTTYVGAKLQMMNCLCWTPIAESNSIRRRPFRKASYF